MNKKFGKNKILLVFCSIVLVGSLLISGDRYMSKKFEASESYNFMVKFIVRNGKKIFYYENDNAAAQHTIVFISGSGVSSTYVDMYSLWSSLENLAKIVFYDRPGMGKSERGDSACDIDKAVDNLATVLEKTHSKEPYIFVAHSLGSLEAIRYAQLYPAKVKCLIFIDGISPGCAVQFKDSLANIAPLMGFARNIGLIRLISIIPGGRSLFRSQADIPDSVRELEVELICRNFWNTSLVAERKKITENGKKVLEAGKLENTKILVLTAQKNTMENWAACQEELKRLSNFSEQFFYDSGHFLHHEHAKDVVARIESMMSCK